MLVGIKLVDTDAIGHDDIDTQTSGIATKDRVQRTEERNRKIKKQKQKKKASKGHARGETKYRPERTNRIRK